MNEFQKDYLLKRQDYGVLYPYVMEETVTDIHWNGRQLWIDDLEKGRYMAPEVLSESFANRFSMLLSNLSNKAFNRDNPVMEIKVTEYRKTYFQNWKKKSRHFDVFDHVGIGFPTFNDALLQDHQIFF